MSHSDQVTVCILTFKRPELLARLLRTLEQQQTEGAFGFSVVVVDNDRAETGRPTVSQARARGGIEIGYHLEPVQNLSLARNRAMLAARGDYIAFIDDDEFPANDWLARMLQACRDYQVDGVLGPVLPHFEQEPPSWILRSGVFDRPRYPTGTLLRWDQTRTGNTLLRRSLVQDPANRFDPAFGVHGEDRDFFRRLMERGHKFIWCDTAITYETQPANRLRRKYFIRRALLRGSVAYAHAHSKWRTTLKSVAAVGVYTTALPFLQLSGHHRFMKYFVKNCDHLGRLSAALGYPVEKYMRQI